jgi:hypothetical protein
MVKQYVFCRFSKKYRLCCCPSGFAFFPLVFRFHCPSVEQILLLFCTFVIWFSSGRWKVFRIWLIISVICKNFSNLFGTSFWYESKHYKQLCLFVCSVILLLISILLLTGSFPLSAVILLLIVKTVNPGIDFCNEFHTLLSLPDHLQKEMFLFLCFSLVVSLVRCVSF